MKCLECVWLWEWVGREQKIKNLKVLLLLEKVKTLPLFSILKKKEILTYTFQIYFFAL